MLLFQVLLGFLILISKYGEATVHHTSMSGNYCGDKQRSWCHSLNYTRHILDDGDTIVFYPEKEGTVYAKETVIKFDGHLKIMGVRKGVQIIGEPTRNPAAQTLFLFNISGTLTLKDIDFVNIKLIIASNLQIKNSNILNSTLIVAVERDDIKVNMSRVIMIGHALCPKPTKCTSTSAMKIYMGYLNPYISNRNDQRTKNWVNEKLKSANLIIQDSQFYEARTSIYLFSRDSNVTVIRCKFSGNPNTEIVSGFVRIYSKFVRKVVMRIVDSLFERQGSTGVINKVKNLAFAALRVKLMPPQDDDTKVIVRNTTFKENERGLAITGPVNDIQVTNCTFLNNTVLHAGAGILLLTSLTTKFNINDCIFDGNKAGDVLSVSHDSMKDKRIQLTYDNDLVSIKSSCCIGQVQPLGKGGAIRVQNGTGVIQNSHFRNNTANLLGANLMVEGDAVVTLHNISINTICDRSMVRVGEVFYSTGALVLDDVRVTVCEAIQHNPLIRHTGGPSSLRLTNFNFVCPAQYSLHFSSAPGLREEMGNGSEVASKLLEEMVIHCKPCQGNTYSIDQGIFEYISSNSSLSPQANSSVKLSSIQCLKCPYGAKCSDVIRASDNFWGYHQDEGLVFVRCPEGHCCTGMQCQGFNSCPGNRQGPLCSLCANGTSRNPFNGDCLPDEECSMYGYVCRVLVVLIGWNALVLLASVLRGNIQERGYTLANTQNIEMEEPNVNNAGKVECIPDGKASEGTQQEAPEKPWSYIYILLLIFYIQDTRLFWSSLEKNQLQHGDMITRNIKPIILLISDFSPPFSTSTCLMGTMSGIYGLLLQLATLGGILLPVTVITGLLQALPRADTRAWVTTLGHCSWFVSLAVTQKLMITVFSTLYCVRIAGYTVLYMDSTVECYQPWQISVIVYVIIWFLSAAIVITMAGGSVINRAPSVAGCVVCWWFPIIWLITNLKVLLKRPTRKRTKQIREKLLPSYCLLRQFGFARKEINWLGVILVYRVTLAFAYVTVQESLLRIISMAAAAFVFLLLQTHLRPKATLSIVFMLNLSTVLSVTVLGMALVKAALAMGIKSRSESLMAGMGLWTSWTINILGVWLPFMAFAVSLISLIIHAIWRACRQRT